MSLKRRLLLHICCAPDATIPCRALEAEGYEVRGFFYGNNIHPWCEWQKRRDAVIKLSSLFGFEADIAPYSPAAWLSSTRQQHGEQEGGARCEACFALQLESTVSNAALGGFDHVCTTLSISPRKNPEIINRLGREKAYAAGIKWIDRVWRKNDGFKLSVMMSREMNLYRQNYCGCVYSAKRDVESDGICERSVG